jgi:hypothetical protein
MRNSKEILCTIILHIIVCTAAIGQDTLIKIGGASTIIYGLELTNTDAKYRTSTDINDTIFVIPKSSVSSINYANGTSTIFDIDGSIIGDDEKKICTRARNGAKKYFHTPKICKVVPIVTAILDPPLALFPTLGLTIWAKASNQNIESPYKSLMLNDTYNNCYASKAMAKEVGKIWTNFGYGTAIFGAYVVIATAVIFLLILRH